MTESKEQKIGDNIDARCAKCKDITNHTILSFKDTGKIGSVKCVPCSYEHAYRQPRKKKTGPTEPKLTAVAKKKAKADAEFDELLSDVLPEEIITYDPTAIFKLDDVMNHPVFGLGKVMELITPDKAVIHFKEGPKVLICTIKDELSS